MLNWSDLHPVDARPAAAGSASSGTPGRRPPARGLRTDRRPARRRRDHRGRRRVTSVDLLLRSAPDAEEIAELLDDTKGQVFCGALDRFGADETYDVIVALDGLERLVGPDTPKLTWTEALACLQSRLAPDRPATPRRPELLRRRTLDPAPITAALPRDEDWARDLADTAPAGLKPSSRLRSTVSNRTTYAVFPSLVEALGRADRGGWSRGCRDAAERSPRERRPDMMDPYRLMLDATEAGLGEELAPGWYFVPAPPTSPECLARRSRAAGLRRAARGVPPRCLAGRRPGDSAPDHS